MNAQLHASDAALIKRIVLAGIAMIAIAFIVLLDRLSPLAMIFGDWRENFWLAGRAVIAGRNPYDVSGFYSPAWLAWASAPLALFPPQTGGALLFAANLFAYAYVASKVKPNFFLFALTGIPIAWNSLLANINGLSLMGIFLPAPLGLLLLSLKPQTGLALAGWKLYMDWTEGKKKEVARAALVILILVTVAFIVYPDWMDKMLAATGNEYNTSLWPYALPIGVLLFYQAIRTRDVRYALMACCLATPYLTWHTWAYFAIGLFSLKMKDDRAE